MDIAYYGGSQPVQSGEISNRQGIPRRYLEQVLQHLVRAGILAGHRGPKGGYMLAKERRRISLGEIVRAVRQFEGGSDPVETASGSRVGLEVVRPLWRQLQQEMLAKLDAVTLEDLCQKAQTAAYAPTQTSGWTSRSDPGLSPRTARMRAGS